MFISYLFIWVRLKLKGSPLSNTCKVKIALACIEERHFHEPALPRRKLYLLSAGLGQAAFQIAAQFGLAYPDRATAVRARKSGQAGRSDVPIELCHCFGPFLSSGQ